MILTKCPACAHELKTPDSFLGKKVRCKAQACGHVFVVAQAPAAPAAPADAPPVDDTASFPVLQPADAVPQIQTAAAPLSRGADRYPNLRKYLGWAKAVALIELLAAIIVSGLIFITSLGIPLSRNVGLQDAILFIVPGFVTSLLIGLAGYIIYVATMAGIELVHVIVDIEANTRALPSNTPEG